MICPEMMSVVQVIKQGMIKKSRSIILKYVEISGHTQFEKIFWPALH